MCNQGQLKRIFPLTGAEIDLWIDNKLVKVREGQSVLSAVLENSGHVRRHDKNGEPRAGFCLMGACQDCWVWLSKDQRGRSCTTPVKAGMHIYTNVPGEGEQP